MNGIPGVVRSTVIVSCLSCRREAKVVVTMRPVDERLFDVDVLEDERCGSDAGWHRHRTVGTTPCAPCADAHKQASQRWIASNRDKYRTRQRDYMREQRRVSGCA